MLLESFYYAPSSTVRNNPELCFSGNVIELTLDLNM